MQLHFFSSSLLMLPLAAVMASCAGNGSNTAAGNTQETDSVEIQGVETLRLDSVSVTWIQDNAQDKLMPRTLFADAPDSIIDRLSLQEGIPSTVSTFWVETAGKGILFDTGVGAPGCKLMQGLEAIGIAPEDVRYIYLTHFHGDHIGGMMRGDTVVFPHAEVYASQVEYDAWMQMPAAQKALVEKTMQAYKEHLHLFAFGDTLPGGVVAIDAVGHTPGHTAFRVGKLLVVGDLMHGAALQLPYPEYCADYDMDKPAAVATRLRILQYARDNGLTMAGMHLPAPAFIIAGK